jgi:hypothetical protein
MHAARAMAKVFVAHSDIDSHDTIAIFHRWIQTQRLDDTLLIDVADYSHVHHGPGVLLVAHEAYWGMDASDGRLGMQYRRRLAAADAAEPALRAALHHALRACAHLEKDLAGKLTFDTRELLVGFDDRLRAPNSAASYQALESSLRSVADALRPGAEATVEHAGTPKGGFRARLRYADAAPLGELLDALKPAQTTRKLRIM